jgi:predicted protein tyrosine phosphatase
MKSNYFKRDTRDEFNKILLPGNMYESSKNTKEKKSTTRNPIEAEIDQITDKIFLGNYEAAKSKEILIKKGITHIITIGMEMDTLFENYFEYLVIRIRDTENEKIFEHFYECFEFIEKADKVFIHCREGISRSATITIAYLIWKYNMTFRESLKLVMKKRRKINPNNGFLKQLKMFEKSLEKLKDTQN